MGARAHKPGLSAICYPTGVSAVPVEVLEASYLRDLLERHGGNISAAAKAAGIDRKTFHRLINKYQIRG